MGFGAYSESRIEKLVEGFNVGVRKMESRVTLRFSVLSNWVDGLPLTEIIKIIEEVALERNQEFCFEYVKSEMPVRH